MGGKPGPSSVTSESDLTHRGIAPNGGSLPRGKCPREMTPSAAAAPCPPESSVHVPTEYTTQAQNLTVQRDGPERQRA